jgi:hypothetical protein
MKPILILLPILISGCLFGGSESSDPYNRVESTRSYTQSGNTLVILGGQADTLRYCGTGPTPITVIDTVRNDTSTFEIKDGSLIILNKPIALDSQAVIRYVSTHTRVGGGSTLIGKWRWTGNDYQVVSGTLTARQKAAQDLNRETIRQMLSKFSFIVEFTASSIISSTDQKPADAFVEGWNDGSAPLYSDTSGFAMKVRILNANTVEIKGLATGEILKVTLSETNSDFQVTSSDPNHAAFSYFEKPTQCPSPEEPVWYEDYLGDNSKSPGALAKAADRGNRMRGMGRFSPKNQYFFRF